MKTCGECEWQSVGCPCTCDGVHPDDHPACPPVLALDECRRERDEARAEAARLRDERNQWRAAAEMQVSMDDIEARRRVIVERFGLDALREGGEGQT